MSHARSGGGEGQGRRSRVREEVEDVRRRRGGRGDALAQPWPGEGVLREEAELTGSGRAELERERVHADRPRLRFWVGPARVAIEPQRRGRPGVPRSPSRLVRGRRCRAIHDPAPEPLQPPAVAGVHQLVSVRPHGLIIAGCAWKNRRAPCGVFGIMKGMNRSLRVAVLALLVAVLVACTPGGTTAPAASGGAPAPASGAPAPGY